MQSSTRHTTSSASHQSSTYVIRTNGQQLIGQSIAKEYESEPSNALSKEKDDLLMRVLMMGFEIERKDLVVKNLLRDIEALEMRNSVSASEEIYAIRQQLIKTRRHAQQLEHKVSQLQLLNSQLTTSKTSTCQHLQQQLRSLQHRHKQLEIKKIQVESQLHKLQTQNKMLTFKMVNVESTEKGKSREMQNMIGDLEKRVEDERKLAAELKIIIQTLHEEIRVMKENEQQICRQFDLRMANLHKQFSYKEDLKRSQAVSSQQKIQMAQGELLRMQQEVKFLRKKLDDQQIGFQKREAEMMAQVRRGKEIQAEVFRLRHGNQVMRVELQQRVQQVNTLVKELNEARSAYTALQQSRQLSSLQATTTYTHQITILQQQSQTLRQRIISLQQELQKSRSQARKLKRKSQNNTTECTSCKILQSATSIKSNKAINDLNLAEIIQQTERLHDSSLKIQQILSSKRIGILGSSYESRMSIDNSFAEY